jgi:membrane-associated protease RseP (regulator of RpoE activity)
MLFISKTVAGQLGLEADENDMAKLSQFEVEGGAVLTNVQARIEDLFQLEGINGLGLAGKRLHGIIGYSVLARYRMEFDFTRDTILWTELDFNPPAPLVLNKGSGAPGGLNALGGAMKLIGGLLGKKAEAGVRLRGFLGLEAVASDGSLTVTHVLADGPAARAGLKPGDLIVSVQGKRITTLDELRKVVAELKPGETTKWIFRRGAALSEASLEPEQGF